MPDSLVRTIQVAHVDVEVHNFGKHSFYYPAFNGNAEFPVTSKGYRALSHYIRTCRYLLSEFNKTLQSRAMPDSRTPNEQAEERYPNYAENVRADYNREGFLVCLTERAIPAEKQLAERDAELSLMRETVKKLVEVLDPFTQPDLGKLFAGNTQSRESIVYQRDKATLKIGDFVATVEALSLAKERHPFLNEKQDEQRG